MKAPYTLNPPRFPTVEEIESEMKGIIWKIEGEIASLKGARKKVDRQHLKSLKEDLEFYKNPDETCRDHLRKEAQRRINTSIENSNFIEIGRIEHSSNEEKERVLSLHLGPTEYQVLCTALIKGQPLTADRVAGMGYLLASGTDQVGTLLKALVRSRENPDNHGILLVHLPAEFAEKAERIADLADRLEREIQYHDKPERRKILWEESRKLKDRIFEQLSAGDLKEVDHILKIAKGLLAENKRICDAVATAEAKRQAELDNKAKEKEAKQIRREKNEPIIKKWLAKNERKICRRGEYKRTLRSDAGEDISPTVTGYLSKHFGFGQVDCGGAKEWNITHLGTGLAVSIPSTVLIPKVTRAVAMEFVHRLESVGGRLWEFKNIEEMPRDLHDVMRQVVGEMNKGDVSDFGGEDEVACFILDNNEANSDWIKHR